MLGLMKDVYFLDEVEGIGCPVLVAFSHYSIFLFCDTKFYI